MKKTKSPGKWLSNTELEILIGKFVCDIGEYDSSKYGDCNKINSTVAFILFEMGVPVIPISGYVEVDKPYRSDSPDYGDFNNPSHFWIQRSDWGRIIDLANIQFVENVYTCDLTRVKYFKKQEHEIDNEWVNQNIVENARKQKWFLER